MELAKGDPLAVIHARSESDADAAEAALRDAYTFGEARPTVAEPVLERVTAS